jgi:hypothetical protein
MAAALVARSAVPRNAVRHPACSCNAAAPGGGPRRRSYDTGPGKVGMPTLRHSKARREWPRSSPGCRYRNNPTRPQGADDRRVGGAGILACADYRCERTPRAPRTRRYVRICAGSVQVLCRFCAGFWTPAMMRCLALGRPASKKRQGTKSREVWRRLCRERYGDLIFAPAVMVGAMRASGDLHGCAQGSLEACSGYLGRGVDRIDWRSAG